MLPDEPTPASALEVCAYFLTGRVQCSLTRCNGAKPRTELETLLELATPVLWENWGWAAQQGTKIEDVVAVVISSRSMSGLRYNPGHPAHHRAQVSFLLRTTYAQVFSDAVLDAAGYPSAARAAKARARDLVLAPSIPGALRVQFVTADEIQVVDLPPPPHVVD